MNTMFTTTKDVTVSFSSFAATGAIGHIPSKNALVFSDPMEPDEVISTNLSAYGLVAQENTTFIKDWSEHQGLTASLVAAGVVEIVRELTVGPFNSRAYEVRVVANAFTAPAQAQMAGV